jgi:Rieske Fe-S protein
METECQCRPSARLSPLRENGLNRRDLIRYSLLLPGAPSLCCNTPEVPPASVKYEGSVVIIDLKQAPDLLRTGAAGKIVDEPRKLDIIVAHTEKNRFVALDRSCTHGSAPVTYNHRHRTVQCTSLSHSEFDLSGAVLRGPARRPIRTHKVRLAGSRLEITLEEEA